MHDHISLEVLDQDGALRETAEAAGVSRGDFLKRSGMAGAGFVAGGVLFNGLVSPASAQTPKRKKSKKNDIAIGRYALTLEYLEAAFYAAALQSGALTDAAVLRFAQVAGAHEAAHVKALRALLGRRRIASPTFNFGDTVTNQDKFKATAQAVEDVGVSAYAGQGPNILQKALLVPALGIHSVEARHAAWIRFINSGGQGDEANLPAPAIVDAPRSANAVLRIVGSLNVIQDS